MNFTPGPWRYSTEPQPNGCPIIGAGPLMVAMLSHSVHQSEQREVALANARLISAAPDLLEAAREAYELLTLIHDETGKVGTKLRLAIDKAYGA